MNGVYGVTLTLDEAKLAVSAKQVFIFLTMDNKVVSFFESSANDIELLIL
jgi:hypothetical protein